MVRSNQFKPLRSVDPPERVLVDLSALYPPPPHHQAEYKRGGIKVKTVVEGKLLMWGMTEDGFALAQVSFQMEFGQDKTLVTQWVPGEVVQRKRS